ncbi:MAG: ATP-binding protein [Candidatus Zixiibacteriota bacterium]
MTTQRYQFSYPSISESEGRFLDDVERVLRKYHVEATPAQRLMLAMSEAFTNALVHANRRQPDKRILVDIAVNETEISADITDEGVGGVKAIERKSPPGLLAEGGRGIDLIRHCSSEVSFRENAGGGLTVTIRVKREKNTVAL